MSKAKRKKQRRNKKVWRKMYQDTLEFIPEILSKKNGFKEAFRHGSLVFYGGPEYDIDERAWDVIISCRERNEFSVSEIYSNAAEKLVRVVCIPWDNMSVADLTREQWKEVVNLLPEKGEVAVCCFGGRGRTGTALAILRALITGDKTLDPVAVIRKQYDQTAIEANIQVLYVESITGLSSACDGSYNLPMYYPFDDCYGGWGNLDSYDNNEDYYGTKDAGR